MKPLLIYAIVILSLMLAIVWLDRRNAPPTLLVQADYQRCITVVPAPLLKPPGRDRSNNRGVA